MSPVFGHGRLRLYLLRLLEEHPRHGYEIIQLLGERFGGLYQPSAGTVYPRLNKLAEEGLVTQSHEGGRKVYQITKAGQRELLTRQAELVTLEGELQQSMHKLAEEIREHVHGSVHDMRQQLKQAAAQARRDQRDAKWENWSQYVRGSDGPWSNQPSLIKEQNAPANPAPSGNTVLARDVERRIDSFADHAREIARQANPTQEQLASCDDVLTQALSLLRAALK